MRYFECLGRELGRYLKACGTAERDVVDLHARLLHFGVSAEEGVLEVGDGGEDTVSPPPPDAYHGNREQLWAIRSFHYDG